MDDFRALPDPHDPFRETDWRWRRAIELMENDSGIHRSTEDNTVRRACRYLRLDRRGGDGAYIAMSQMGDVARARRIYLEGDQRLRWSIEARILAGESDEIIAGKCGTDDTTIAMYERLFFAVRDRLEQSDWIVHCVMGPAVQLGLQERDYDLLWKLYGYFAGSEVLDVVMYQFSPRGSQLPPDRYLAKHASQALARKAALAAQTAPINGFTAGDILNAYARFLELEQKVSDSGQSRSVLAKNIEAMLQALPWTTGERTARELDSPAVLMLDNSGAEMTGDELLAAHAGETILLPTEPIFPE